MLFIITKPFQLEVGSYKCDIMSPDDAATLIKQHHDAGNVKSLINFASTKATIQKLTGISFAVVQKFTIPQPSDGDQFLQVKLKDDAPKGKPSIEHLEFLLINFNDKLNR